VHGGRQASYHQQSSQLPLNGQAGIPALGWERWNSPAGRHSVKHWASGITCRVSVTPFFPSVGILAFSLYNGGVRALWLSGTMGRAGSLCTLGGQPPVSCRIADCHSVGELGF
jgi:hypothetical protein